MSVSKYIKDQLKRGNTELEIHDASENSNVSKHSIKRRSTVIKMKNNEKRNSFVKGIDQSVTSIAS